MSLLEQMLSLLLASIFCLGLWEAMDYLRVKNEVDMAADEARGMADALSLYLAANVSRLATMSSKESGPFLSGHEGPAEEIRPYLGLKARGKYKDFRIAVRREELPGGMHALVGVMLGGGVGGELGNSAVARRLTRLGRADFNLAGKVMEISGVSRAGVCRGAGFEYPLSELGIESLDFELCHVIRLPEAETWARLHASENLYRIAIAGLPALNRMETDLDLGSNTIRGVGGLQLETRNLPCAEENLGLLRLDGEGRPCICSHRDGVWYWMRLLLEN